MSNKLNKENNYKIGIITKNKKNTEKIISGKILHLDGDSCLDNKNSLLT